MTQSLTDWLHQSRLIVVAVDPERRRVRVKGEADACTDLSCEQTLVVSEEGTGPDLTALNPGDIVKVAEDTAGRPQRIVVVRRVWEELTSPEW